MTESELRRTYKVAANLLLFRNNTILLSRRFNTGYLDGYYSIVGGHLEPNETLMQAAIREAKEETGIIILPEHLEFAHLMHHHSETGRLQVFFMCQAWEGEPIMCEPNKCDDLAWFDPSALPEKTVPYVRETIAHVLRGIRYSEFGW